ncbi:YciK family oxidoreductase [Enterobacteriaceae bacterium LUAb1]
MEYQARDDLLSQRIILITGASDGIGREAALTYARHDAQLILLGRNPTKLQRVVQEINPMTNLPVDCFVLDMDNATPEQCQQLATRIAATVPHLDGVLHNAGFLGEIAPMTAQTPAIWQQVMRVNIDSTFFLTQALLPLLLKSPSASLIFTSSSVGRKGRAGWGAYSVSKFATEGMMQVLAAEYQHTSLRVNCINPGGTRTTMRHSAFPAEDASKLKTPADIMPLYLWLMGDDSRGETGKTFDAQPHRKTGPAE